MTDHTVRLDDPTLGPTETIFAQRAREYLDQRGIPTKWAIECGMELELDDGSIKFQYPKRDGALSDFARWRLFDEDIKFYQEEDSPVRAYMPPLKHPKLTMQDVLSDPKHPLIIAEGETRAAALNYRGLPTVAIGGVSNFGKNGELCADLRDIPWQGREVVYAFDSDTARRPRLQDSVLKFARLLAEQGAQAKLLPIPDLGDGHTGADDYIVAEGKREFVKLLKTAKPHDHPDFDSWGTNGIDIDLSLRPIGSDWLHRAPSPIEYTWDRYLPRGSVGLLVAEGGTGKTYLPQALAQSVAGGVPFLGLPTRQGKAVHIAFEEVPDELRRRQYAIFQTEIEDFPKDKLARFIRDTERNLYVKSVVGQEIHLAVMDGSNVVQGRALSTLIYHLRELGNVELVVIDPLSRAHSIDNESQAWGTVIINACERIALEVGCTVLLTHHTGKGKEREDLYSARGASALPDAARVVLRLKEATLEDTKYTNLSEDDIHNHRILRLVNSKLNYGPRQPDIWLYRTGDGVLTPFSPAKTESSFKAQLDELYLFMEGTKRESFSRTEIRRNRAEIFNNRGISDREVRKLLDMAKQCGSLIETSKKIGGSRRLRFAESYQQGVPK